MSPDPSKGRHEINTLRAPFFAKSPLFALTRYFDYTQNRQVVLRFFTADTCLIDIRFQRSYLTHPKMLQHLMRHLDLRRFNDG